MNKKKVKHGLLMCGSYVVIHEVTYMCSLEDGHLSNHISRHFPSSCYDNLISMDYFVTWFLR